MFDKAGGNLCFHQKQPPGETTLIELFGMGSPNVRKIGIMLEELGVDYVLHHVAVFRGDQFKPGFLAMNPLGKVPVLIDHTKDPASPIYESGAILFYLAETYGALLPGRGPARYEVMEWLMVQMSGVGPMFGQHNHFQLLGAQADPYAASRYRTQAKLLYQQLNERLSDREWIAGDAYSIADIAIYPWALYLEQHGFEPAAHPALIRWRNMIGARDAVKRSWERFAAAFDKEGQETRRAATAAQLDAFFYRDPCGPPVDYSVVTKR
jgi:GSH-dependent disulfide-bond oxidoreductase